MTAGQVLTLAGAGIQVLGAVVALAGLVRTHDEFADQTLRALVVERAQGAWGRARAFGRRLLRRPPQKVVGAGAAIGGAGSLAARGRIGWAPLPGTLQKDIAALERRTQQLLDSLANTQERLEDTIADVRAEVRAVKDHLAAADNSLEELARRAAIGGVRLEALGLFLVILGLALQGIGAAISYPGSTPS